MSQEAVVTGTLHADGTLDLDQKPALMSGRGRVTLQLDQSGSQRHGLADVLDEIHRGQKARGFVGRTAEDIDTALQEGEEEYEDRIKSLRVDSTSKSQGD